jgi:hypothetical protein
VSPQLHQHLLASNQVLVFAMNKKNGREMKKKGKKGYRAGFKY